MKKLIKIKYKKKDWNKMIKQTLKMKIGIKMNCKIIKYKIN